MRAKIFTRFLLFMLAGLLLQSSTLAEEFPWSELDTSTYEFDFAAWNKKGLDKIPNSMNVDPTSGACAISTDGCEVVITGLTGTDYVKLLDASYNPVWDCNPWVNGGCNATETITGLPIGTYIAVGCGGAHQTIVITGCGNADPCAGNGGDSDGDGVCNNQDCQPNNPAYPATPGSPCDDGNANTDHDVVTSDGCGCAGIPVGGACSVYTDGCEVTISGLNGTDYIKILDATYNPVWDCNPWVNGGCNATETITGLPNGTYIVTGCGANKTVVITGCGNPDPCASNGGDSDGDGVCDNQDCQPNNPAYPATPGSPCNDGNPNTSNDKVTADGCGCAGTIANPCATNGGDSDGDGVCDNQDCQPNNPAYPATPGSPCNDGNPNTSNDKVTADGCGCSGTPVGGACSVYTDGCEVTISGLNGTDYIKILNAAYNPVWDCNPWVNGGCNATETITGLPNGTYIVTGCGANKTIVITGCGNPDPCASNGGDSDGDGVCNNQDCQPNNPAYPATPGSPCDDGNPNTSNDKVTADGCGCAGTIVNPCAANGGDSDGDGVCDNQDCQPNNPNFPATPGTACDDGNPNTINDVVAANGCGCAGQLNAPLCIMNQYDHSTFESGFGFWIDGGADCRRAYLHGANGSWWAIELEDNGSNAAMYTPSMDLSNTDKVKFDFAYKGSGMDNGEKLMLEYSVNGGSTYHVIQEWIKGTHFNNGSYINESVTFSYAFSASTKFRFRCHASSALDKVYLDNVIMSKCTKVPFDPYANQRPVYRTIDGTLNNFDNPAYGTTHIPLYREIPAQYGDGVSSLGGQNRPSTRHISNILSDEPQDRRDPRLLSGMAYQFGQFLDHDIVLSEGGTEFAPIPVPAYDPIFTPNSIIPFTRSKGIPGSSPRDQANIITSYIDASNVYGSDPEIAAYLRTFTDGKLKTSKGNLLPYNTIDNEFDSPIDFNAPRMERDEQGGQRIKLFIAGDFRANEHPNLTSFHTIFVREHNRLCDQIKSSNSSLSDEEIYQKARKLIGAMMQRIVYKEFLPSFGISLSSYYGYDPQVRPDIRNTFATAAYRWHTMVENDIILRNDNCEGIGAVELPLKSIFHNPSVIRSYGPGVLLQGLSFHPQYRTDLKVNNGLRNFLFGPGAGFDLVAINLQRGRDHGLPDYKTVRQYYGLSQPGSFSDINSDSEIYSRLQSVYGNVNNIDLWAGLFAEPLVSGTSLPATVIAMMKAQFEALRDGDFYYYENDPALSSSDLSLINSSKLATIIERNSSAKNLPSDIFFKPPCDNDNPLEDTRDEGHPVCNGYGAEIFSSCSGSYGQTLSEGNHGGGNIAKIKVTLGFGVKIFNNQGESAYYTDDTGCLPDNFRNNISSIHVICLSKELENVDCSGFAGALFKDCFSSPIPIIHPGMYTLAQLKTIIPNDDLSALRVNNGFQVTLYKNDLAEGASESITYTGPSVVCLPSHWNNTVSSMEVLCLSDLDFNSCEFEGIGGAVFKDSGIDSHIGASLGVGDYDWARLQAMGLTNDDIEKVHVTHGFAVTLFKHDNFQGDHIVLLGNKSDLGSAAQNSPSFWDLFNLFGLFNSGGNQVESGVLANEASSIKVRCLEGLQGRIIPEPLLNLTAIKESDKVKLAINFQFAKATNYQIIEKFNGRTGEFEMLTPFVVDGYDGTFSTYDNNPLVGDNIYRVKVFYTDGTEGETPYEIVRFDNLDAFQVYPNPTIDIVYLNLEKFEGQNVDVFVYDMLGQEIAAKKFVELSDTEISFDLSFVNGGTYVVRVAPEGKKALAKKFTIIKD